LESLVHDINDMLFFAHVVKVRSFSEAARRLDVSKSRVSKAIARLESDLGVRLLHRSTRSLSLTDVGEAYFEHCDRILEELSLADTTISRLHQEPRGKLKISAPVAFSTMHVASALPDFMALYPDLTVDLTISDRLVDLADEGYDSPCASPASRARTSLPANWRRSAARSAQAPPTSPGAAFRWSPKI
jgi:DNA-binding transcriptional LysR family regulator